MTRQTVQLSKKSLSHVISKYPDLVLEFKIQVGNPHRILEQRFLRGEGADRKGAGGGKTVIPSSVSPAGADRRAKHLSRSFVPSKLLCHLLNFLLPHLLAFKFGRDAKPVSETRTHPKVFLVRPSLSSAIPMGIVEVRG